jgi:hypothetical protein
MGYSPDATQSQFIKGGIFGIGSSSATYNIALITTIDGTSPYPPTPGYTGGSPSPQTYNYFGQTSPQVYPSPNGAQLNVGAGIDLYMNPNLWSVAPGSSGTCYAGNRPGIGNGVLSPGGSPYWLHCTAFNQNTTSGANWIRLRAIVGGSVDLSPTWAGSPNFYSSPAANLYTTYFWTQYVQLTSFTGASLKADNNAGDYYVALYGVQNSVIAPRASPTSAPSPITGSVLAISSNPNASDYGEIVATGTGGSTVDGFYQSGFFTSYVLAPMTSTFTSPNFNNSVPYLQVAAWLAGYDPNTASNSNNNLNFLRIRGKLVSADASAIPTTGKLAIFLQMGNGLTTNATIFKPLAPTSLSGTTGNSRCFMNGAVVPCNMERNGRSYTQLYAPTSPLVPYDLLSKYQLFTITSTFAVGSNFSINLLLQPNSAYTSPSPNNWINYRLGFQNGANSANYYIQGANLQIWSPISPSPASVAVGGIACNGTFVAGIRPVPAVTDIVNQVITNESWSVGAGSGTSPLAGTTTYGGAVFCAQTQGTTSYTWDFRGTTGGFTIVGPSQWENATSGDKCAAFDYVSVDTPVSNFVCLWCPNTSGAGITSAVTFSTGNFKAPNAVDIVIPVFQQLIGNTGLNGQSSVCSYSVNLYQPNPIPASSSSGSAYNLQGQKVTFTVTTPSTLQGITQVQFTGYNSGGNDLNFPYGTADPLIWCSLVPSTSIGNPTLYATTCGTPTISSGVVSLSWNAADVNIVNSSTSWTFIIWGVNGINAPTTPATSATYYVTTYRPS